MEMSDESWELIKAHAAKPYAKPMFVKLVQAYQAQRDKLALEERRANGLQDWINDVAKLFGGKSPLEVQAQLQAQAAALAAYEQDMNAARGELGVSLEESPIGSLVSKLVMANRVLRSEHNTLQQQLADAQQTIKEHQDEACAEKLHHQQATIQRLEGEIAKWEMHVLVPNERHDELLAKEQRLANVEAAVVESGKLVGSSCGKIHGWYQPETADEVKATVAQYKARIRSLVQLIRQTEGAAGFKEFIGQLAMEFEEEVPVT